MVRIFSARSLAEAQIVRDALRREGIHAELRNEHLASAAGGVPFTEAWVELWVDEAQEARSKELIRLALSEKDAGADWYCGACQETVPGELSECWKCQRVR